MPNRRAVSVLLFAGLAGGALPAFAATAPLREIGRDDPIRRVLLDALRPTIERDLGQKVIFVVDELRLQGDAAFAMVRPRQPDGAGIDFTRTRYAADIREGVFDGERTAALLRRRNGVWRVLEFVIGPTDLAWEAWPQQYGVSRQLVGLG